jgi:hypothetical protein
MSWAADATTSVPLGKISAVTAKKMRREIRETKQREAKAAVEARKWAVAKAMGVGCTEDIIMRDGRKVCVPPRSIACGDSCILPPPIYFFE